MYCYLWVEVTGSDWEGTIWVGRRILRLEGLWSSIEHALNAAVEAAGRELAQRGIVISNELTWVVKNTMEIPQGRKVYIVDYPSKDGKPLNLVWSTERLCKPGRGVSRG